MLRRSLVCFIGGIAAASRSNMQFRAEAFNVRNEVVLRGPTTDPYNTAFGRVTAQEPPRSWQFSLKLAW